MERPALQRKDIAIGKLLPWSLFDQKERLLLTAGNLVGSIRQRDALLQRGAIPGSEKAAYTRPRPEACAKGLPFQRQDEIVALFRFLLDDLEQRKREAIPAITALAECIASLCREYRDAVIGIAHLVHEYEYSVIHPLHKAILTHALCEQAGYSTSSTRSILCAALTANISIRHLQDQWQILDSRLDPTQQRLLQAHPAKSVAWLVSLGLKDRLWQTTILQHHESPDGNGYPKGLIADQISEPALIVHLADRYAAMISSRSYRASMTSMEALRSCYAGRGMSIAEDLSQQLIRIMGVYPPGTLVRLSNTEAGMVVDRGPGLGQPKVVVWLAPGENPWDPPITRDCNRDELQITGFWQPEINQIPDLRALWHRYLQGRYPIYSVL